MRSSMRERARQIRLVKEDKTNKLIWEETIQYEVTEDGLNVDLKGAQDELSRLEGIKDICKKRFKEAKNDVDRIGATNELQRVSVLVEDLKTRIRGMQQTLGSIRGKGNADIPDRPGRGR